MARAVGVSDIQLFKQSGNAVTVTTAAALFAYVFPQKNSLVIEDLVIQKKIFKELREQTLATIVSQKSAVSEGVIAYFVFDDFQHVEICAFSIEKVEFLGETQSSIQRKTSISKALQDFIEHNSNIALHWIDFSSPKSSTEKKIFFMQTEETAEQEIRDWMTCYSTELI